MGTLLRELAEIITLLHSFLIKLFIALGFNFNDKELHFIIIGLLGIVIYFMSQMLFKQLAKWSIGLISFVYTTTVLVVIVFAIEIQQKLTGSGHMEFADIVYGMWGYFFLMAIYLIIVGVYHLVKRRLEKAS